MNRVAIAFNTCDRTELTKRSIEPLLQPGKFDLWWIDGSKTEEGQNFPSQTGIRLQEEGRPHGCAIVHSGIRGGSGPAIVYALTMLLKEMEAFPNDSDKKFGKPLLKYDYIGLVENDVLLQPNWFDDMMALFSHPTLEVGAVSARCYEDRILFQRDGYAVCHNLGAGMIMFSRKAAEIVLHNYRTVWTTENRLLFSQLSGIDIGKYWAFRGMQHFLVADWNFDRVLAAHGLASLALTPNRVEMIDQDIEPLGLKYADGDLHTLYGVAGGDMAFERYCDNLLAIRVGEIKPAINEPFYRDHQGYTIFAHQVPQIGGTYSGDWRVRDVLGFGPFCWRCGDPEPWEEARFATDEVAYKTELVVPILGPCDVLVSGGKTGGKVSVEDEHSGFKAEPDLYPEGADGQVLQLSIPGAATYRNIRLTALTPGVCFMGIKTAEMQPHFPNVKFDYNTLPPV